MGDKVRPDVGIPRTHELENGDGDKRRGGQGDHDSPKEGPVAFSVDFRRQIEFIGNLLEILTEQIDVEDGDDEWNDHGKIGLIESLGLPNPAEARHGDVVRNNHHFPRNHHGHEEDCEHRIAPFEFEPSKGKGCKDRGEESS